MRAGLEARTRAERRINPEAERRIDPGAERRINPGAERRINIVQGERRVTCDPDVVITTLLGSCVAACLCDPVAGVGGMNHFLLPGDGRGTEHGATGAVSAGAMRYGVHAMELLVNELLRGGAQRSRLEGKLFGGARMMTSLTNIGELNAVFAERFLADEGIALVGGSLRGERGRRIQFWPVSGRARQMIMPGEQVDLFRSERQVVPQAPAADAGSVELF